MAIRLVLVVVVVVVGLIVMAAVVVVMVAVMVNEACSITTIATTPLLCHTTSLSACILLIWC
ncbi:hypothetical protein E2C01_091424 [Portunus trituberculatus]|uniref:Uncharacterized protein n=1 Tax=Portunus trituberculatus TaxID=210409 RepID=A0A5B7JJ09_PORTR|nr:hypothetical protein [Portunus trituberculatus]